MKKLSVMHLQKLRDKLDQLSTYYAELIEDLPNEEEFLRERMPRRAVEKTIELIADTILDVASIIISAQGFEKPKEASESVMVLSKHGILSKNLMLKIQDLIRFRNLLVHQYAKIDEKREYENIAENHPDILAFVKEIEKFVKKSK